MKEIKIMEPVYLEEFDIHVNPYLTMAQIQQICDAVKKFNIYAERQQNIDMLVLYHTTDFGKEALNEIEYDTLYCSGLIGAVKDNIINIYEINKAIEYTESTSRAVSQILKQLPEFIAPLKKVMDKNGNAAKK